MTFLRKTHEFKMTNWQMLAFQFLTSLLISRKGLGGGAELRKQKTKAGLNRPK